MFGNNRLYGPDCWAGAQRLGASSPQDRRPESDRRFVSNEAGRRRCDGRGRPGRPRDPRPAPSLGPGRPSAPGARPAVCPRSGPGAHGGASPTALETTGRARPLRAAPQPGPVPDPEAETGPQSRGCGLSPALVPRRRGGDASLDCAGGAQGCSPRGESKLGLGASPRFRSEERAARAGPLGLVGA